MTDSDIKELALSKQFFMDCGLPLIQSRFGSFEQRIAVGLVGSGSGCFGYDDEISRDHDWGPGFCLFLTKADYKNFGQELQAEYDQLPRSYKGFTRFQSPLGANRTGVFEIGAFYKTFISLSELPEDLNTWRVLPEQYLATCTNGEVFRDPCGEFSHWRQTLLGFYPDDIRLKKIAARCMSIAQSGQYNLPRLFKRNEPLATRYAETKFCADTISLIFLLNKRYTPFYKWMHRALRDLPILGESCAKAINTLLETNVNSRKTTMVESICAKLISELTRQDLTDSTSDFLLDHGPRVQARIRNPQLKQTSVWVE